MWFLLMQQFQNRFERLELKYLIDETTAERIRGDIDPYCNPDPHSDACAIGRAGRAGYDIRSLYLDSPALAFHAAKLRCDPYRIKLRVRTYSDTSAATLEIKRRECQIIDKTRAVVDREYVELAAMGVEVPTTRKPSSLLFLREFARVAADAGAIPTLHVRYEREAYESAVDQYARVTFDRNIRVRRADGWNLCPPDSGWCLFDDYWRSDHPTLPIVLELKCETIVPFWLLDIIRRYELIQSTFSKYSIGIALTQWQNGGEITDPHSPAHALEVQT